VYDILSKNERKDTSQAFNAQYGGNVSLLEMYGIPSLKESCLDDVDFD
jgi:hypothetical protein